MLFMLGLEKLTREEKVSLLSQIEVLSTGILIKDSIAKKTKQLKDSTFNTASKILSKLSKDNESKVKNISTDLDWDVEILQKKMKDISEHLQTLSDDEISNRMLEKIKKLAKFSKEVTPEILANGILHRVADSFKLDKRLFVNSVDLENAVFEECIKEQINAIKKKINKMNQLDLDRMEDLLNTELNKLSEANRETIRNTLKVDEISGKALLKFMNTVSATVLVQMVINGFGFGFFLFLASMMKAFSMLLGVTFSFSTYTAVSSAFGFFLSLPFLLIVILISGGILTKYNNSKIDNEISKLIVIIGKYKLIHDAETEH